MIETDADRLGMLSDFGVPIVVNGEISFTGIFDDRFKMVDDLGQEVESALPQVVCRSSDCAGISDGMPCTVAGVAYVIRTIEPDGTGVTRLVLHK